MSTDRAFEPTEENIAIAVRLAERASNVVSYYADPDLKPEDLVRAQGNGTGPIWYCWTGTKQDSLFVAITGNGPTSEHNAAFIACAQDVVLGLAAEVRRLRTVMTEAFTLVEKAADASGLQAAEYLLQASDLLEYRTSPLQHSEDKA